MRFFCVLFFFNLSSFLFSQECDLFQSCINKRIPSTKYPNILCEEYDLIYDINNPLMIKRVKSNLILFFPEIIVDSLFTLLKYNHNNEYIKCTNKNVKLISQKKIKRKQTKQRRGYEKIFCFSRPIYYNEFAIIQCLDRVKWSIGCSVLSLYKYEDGKWIFVTELYSLCS